WGLDPPPRREQDQHSAPRAYSQRGRRLSTRPAFGPGRRFGTRALANHFLPILHARARSAAACALACPAFRRLVARRHGGSHRLGGVALDCHLGEWLLGRVLPGRHQPGGARALLPPRGAVVLGGGPPPCLHPAVVAVGIGLREHARETDRPYAAPGPS